MAVTFRNDWTYGLIFVGAFALTATWPCHAQKRNELPMYGGIPPSPKEARADQEFVEEVVKQFGSRENAAKNAVRLGFQYLAKADWKTAIKRFNQAWLLTGESAEVFWGFGSALSYQGRFAEAEKYFLKAKKLDPNNGRLLTDFGFTYQFWATRGTRNKAQRLRYLDESVRLFAQASRLAPDYDRIYFNWAVSLFFKQDYAGAWERIKEAEKLGGRSIDQNFVRDLTRKMPRSFSSGRGIRQREFPTRLRAILAEANSGRSGYAGLAFSPDGRMLATGDEIKPAKLWDVRTGKLRTTLAKHKDSIRVVFSPDGRMLATSGDKKVTLWDTEQGDLKYTLTGSTGWLFGFTYWVAFSPDGRLLLTSGSDSKTRLYEVATGRLKATHECRKGWMFAVFSTDGRIIASACNEDSSPKLWDVGTGQLRATLTGHRLGVTHILFSPDGQTLASQSLDDTVRLWDSETGKLKVELDGHYSTIYQTAFSPDGRRLATASRDGTARLWDVETGELLHTLGGYGYLVQRVSFSPDGRTVTAGGRQAKLWNVESGSLIATLDGHKNDLESIAYSPLGNVLVTASKESARVWNAATGELIKLLEDAHYPVAFSRDGRTLATAGRNKTVLLWDVL